MNSRSPLIRSQWARNRLQQRQASPLAASSPEVSNCSRWKEAVWPPTGLSPSHETVLASFPSVSRMAGPVQVLRLIRRGEAEARPGAQQRNYPGPLQTVLASCNARTGASSVPGRAFGSDFRWAFPCLWIGISKTTEKPSLFYLYLCVCPPWSWRCRQL